MTALNTDTGTFWVRRYGDPPAAVVALHGFTLHGGSFESFAAELGATVFAPDLPGHGLTTIEPISIETATSAVCELLGQAEHPPLLVGYSQGGRVALQVGLNRPDLIASLILVSTAPGLTDRDRKIRRVADDALATRIERLGIQRFVDEWLTNTVTATDRVPPGERSADRKIRLQNDASRLADALRGMGQSTVPDMRDRLRKLAIPACFVAGDRDSRYARLAEEMGALSGQQAVIVPGAGHNVILERPRAVVTEIRKLLNQRTG